jgi:hypothetical protein
MSKDITSAQSIALCRVYKENQGRWRDIMADPWVQATGLERHQVERHINYKKSLGKKHNDNDSTTTPKREALDDGPPEHSPPPPPSKKPKLQRQLSEDSLAIADMMEGNVPSTAVRSADDMERVQEEVRAHDRATRSQGARPSMPQASADTQAMQTSVQMMAVQMMRRMMDEMERDARFPNEFEQALAAHDAEITTLKQELAAVREELALIRQQRG